MDWTFRLRDRRLRRWVAYILAAVFAYLSAPHSASLPRSLRSRQSPLSLRYALSRAAGAHISLRMAQSPAATLRASVQDFHQPQLRLSRPTSKSLLSLFNMVYSVRLSIYWGLSMRCTSYVCVYIMGAFNAVFRYPPRLSIYWGLSIWCSVTLHVYLYMGAFS